MASIVQRGKKFYVVYQYVDERTGKRKQKWESTASEEAAKLRRMEVEYHKEAGTLVVQQCTTLQELLKEYIELYGRNTWSISMYQSTTSLVDHYINPYIGKIKLTEITPRVLEKYYQDLLSEPALPKVSDKKYAKNDRKVTRYTVKRIITVLKSCFHQAMKWELMEKILRRLRVSQRRYQRSGTSGTQKH